MVVEYLDGIGEGALYPQTPSARFATLARLAMGDGLFETAVRMSMEGWREASEQRADLYEWLWPKVTRVLDTLEQALPAPGRFDIGDAGVLQGLSYLDAWAAGNEGIPQNPCIEWSQQWPGLAQWYAAALERPSVRDHYRQAYRGDTSAEYHRQVVASILTMRGQRDD